MAALRHRRSSSACAPRSAEPLAVYLDSSAIVKLVIRERESAAVRRLLRKHRTRVTSAIARVEIFRAVRRADASALEQARDAIERLALIDVSDDVLEAAGLLEPESLRTLDAIHLATAASLGDDLEFVIAYDERLTSAAREIGLSVRSPKS